MGARCPETPLGRLHILTSFSAPPCSGGILAPNPSTSDLISSQAPCWTPQVLATTWFIRSLSVGNLEPPYGSTFLTKSLSCSLARSLARTLSLFLPLCSRPLDACVAASRSVTRGAKAKCLHLFPPPSLASIKKPSSSPLRGGAQRPPRAPPRSPPRSLLLICINPQPHHHLSTNHYQAR